MREAVLHELNVLRRQRLHRRAADALTALGEDRHLEEIAAHLFEAADARRAADMLVRAGRRALDRLAYEDAAERFARALDALALADAERRGRARAARPRRRAAARRRARRGARRVHRGGAARAPHAATPALLGEAALGFAGLGIAIVGLDAETIARLEEALERPTDPVLRSRLQARLARRALLRARPHALGGAERRGGRDRPRRRRRAAPSPPRSTPATSRCGAPTASRSGSRPPPT